MDENQLPVARMISANEQLNNAIRRGFGLAPSVPWEHQRPGLLESAVFIVAAVEVGVLAAFIVDRLIGG